VDVDELQWARDIFDEMGDERKYLLYLKHSNKAQMVVNIIREAELLGENVLVFFHSIPTLEYIKAKLKNKKYKIYDLTGQTPMRERQDKIDKFNKEKSAIFLISSRVTNPPIPDIAF
jgi:SNF2 family DNA or RNA helicase